MSFSKVVNGVTFTSSNFTNIDVNFEKQGAKTYIYISTTDNHAFNSTVFNSSDTVPKIKNIYVSAQTDMNADDNTSSLTLPNSSQFHEVSSLDNNCITTDILKVGGNWFNYSDQNIVWAYFIIDDTPDLEHINPSLKADNVTVSITGNTVNLKANSGYKITSATLDIGNSLYGDDTPLDFNVASDGLSASVTVTDQSLISSDQEYNLDVKTEKVAPLVVHYHYSSLVTVSTSTTDYKINTPFTISATAAAGYSYNNVTDLYSVSPSDGVTLTQNGTQATITLANPETYTISIKDPKQVPKFTGTITSKVKDVNASLNKNTGVINITIPTNTTFTGSVNVLDSTGKIVDTLTITNLTVTIPDKYGSNNFEVNGSLQYETKYTVDIDQIKDYVTYTTNGLVITLTAKDKILINSLHATAELTVLGESYKLDDSTISIAADKKSATINVPTNYNGSGYDIVITGDFSNQTPPPTNPTGTNSIHVYQLDDDTLTKFSTDAIQYYQSGNAQTNYDFQKFITQLYKLPFAIPETESEGTTNILTGWYTINQPARKMNNTRYTLNLGTIKVVNVNDNGFDHNVASCTLYLPYASPINVPYETILNHNLSIKYDTDLLTGKTTVNIFVDDNLLNTLQININENLDLYNIYNDSINGTLSSILNNTLDHCYIKVDYYKPIEKLVAYETNEHGILKDYKGYIQTKNTIVSCGTNEEQQAIKELLEQGVVIKWVCKL